MKLTKCILAVLLVLAVFAGSFVGSCFLFRQGTYAFDARDLAVWEEEPFTYYLQKAPKDSIFRVHCGEDDALAYALTDGEGEGVSTQVQRVTDTLFDILPPPEGYREGGRYTLSLGDGVTFVNEALCSARTLVFCVEREATEAYTLADGVVQLEDVLPAADDNLLDISGMDVSQGDVLFGPDGDGGYRVYKIAGVRPDGMAEVETPALDEIYADLQVYGEYQWDVQDIALNPDIKAEIIQNVRESRFFAELMASAHAAEEAQLDVDIKPDIPNGKLGLDIKITLKPGDDGLFDLRELKGHEVSLTLQTEVALSTRCNMQGLMDWDISATAATGFTWKVDLKLIGKEWKKEGELEDLFSRENKFANLVDYHKKVRKLTEKLDQLAADAAGGDLKLFNWNLPIPAVPGLYFKAEVKLFAKLDMAANISIGQSTDTMNTVGLCFTHGKFDYYHNTYRSSNGVSLALSGKVKAKAGIKLEIKAVLIHENVAHITLDTQAGMYADLYVTFPVSDVKEIDGDNFIYSYFEPGAYFSADIKAELNLLLKKFTFSHNLLEKKFPIDFLTFGNKKIALGITSNTATVHAVNEKVAVPDILFRYYDVKKSMMDTEKLSPSKLKFVAQDGTQLKPEAGTITLPDTAASGDVFLTATYLHTDGKTYSTTFRVLVSGSLLEGKVSACQADGSTQPLLGAKVVLQQGGQPIREAPTDADGRFGFQVAEGVYTLVIQADGYHTLTSIQTVAADEIKYTEHILLMDRGQSGLGRAGGRVTHAMDGSGVGSADIRLRPDWNHTEGPCLDFHGVTDSSGHYSVENIPVGYYTVEASKDGFVTGYTNILVLSEAPRADFDFSITPILDPNEIRIILTWGDTPADLDSHLIGRSPADNPFNVYYQSRVYTYDGVEMANLDTDDTTSYGPETVTILQNIHGSYAYAVHDYSHRSSSGSTALSNSGAVVRVLVGSRQVGEYHVPPDQVGTYWHVFDITGPGRIQPVNTISNTKPAA